MHGGHGDHSILFISPEKNVGRFGVEFWQPYASSVYVVRPTCMFTVSPKNAM